MTIFTVPDKYRGKRLDHFLRTQFSEHSRASLQKLIDEGHVLVNGHTCKPSYGVRAGDRISVEIPPPRLLDAKPEAMPLEILFEDSDLIVVNKPAGMVVHPAAGNFEHTLVNALLHHCRGELAGIGGVQRPGIVHRLDKGTSGCIVVAKTDLAHQALVAQFKSRGVKKIYRALCWGNFERPSGKIETTIGRSVRDRKKMSARAPRGRAALTEYRVLKQRDEFALVELTIHSGRTHQIRVHMAHIGHPVVGDSVYGHAGSGRFTLHASLSAEARAKAERFTFPLARPMLHAYKLGFVHPRSEKPMEFEAPIPEDITRLCQT